MPPMRRCCGGTENRRKSQQQSVERNPQRTRCFESGLHFEWWCIVVVNCRWKALRQSVVCQILKSFLSLPSFQSLLVPFAELSNSIVRPKPHSRGNSRDSRCVVVPLDNHSAYTLVCRECANFRCLVPADLQTVNRNLNWINQQQFTISDRPPKCKSIVIMSWRTATVGGMDIMYCSPSLPLGTFV